MPTPDETFDVVLVGAGVMSATLGSMLKQLEPSWRICVLERLGAPAEESSDGWNNAGTGHSALCELNYMPEGSDGRLDPAKAVEINEQFQLSRQYWSHLVRDAVIADPSSFIRTVPHLTFVRGDADVNYLRRRYDVLRTQPLFAGIEFSDDPDVIRSWAPLLIKKRARTSEPMAATRVPNGTDVDFGSLTRQLVAALAAGGVKVRYNRELRGLKRLSDGTWRLRGRHLVGGVRFELRARHVFVGAGGGALSLLQRSRIPEINGFGGFPISGEFLRTTNPKLVEQHHAKVYGKAASGAPPMSVPHLDVRIVGDTKALLFGPYAGFTPKFLKTGSWFDLPGSVRAHNLVPMLQVAVRNGVLLRYLLGELTKGSAGRLAALRDFMPSAKPGDWELIVAGQRVQVMKRDPGKGGVLQFGTEVVTGADGTIAGLLGASPGASTAVAIMLEVLGRCFPANRDAWAVRLREMIPSYGTKLSDHPDLADRCFAETAAVLRLDEGGARVRDSADAAGVPASTNTPGVRTSANAPGEFPGSKNVLGEFPNPSTVRDSASHTPSGDD